ncbi:TetR/AcrR family transcriptional regulator [Actinopolymorpha pittospori]
MPARTSAERGREVRQRLLDTAATLIPELGWSAVSTRALAERADVTPGLIHYHFSSVQALLREAALRVMGEVVSATSLAFTSADDLDAGLDLMLGALDSYPGEDATSLLFTETCLAATRDPELRAELSTLVAGFRKDLATWLAGHGQDHPGDTAAVLAATIDGLMLHRVLGVELTSATAMTVLRGLVAPAPPSARTASRRRSEARRGRTHRRRA